MKEIVLNTKMKSQRKVEAFMSAACVESGTARVLSTPSLIALMENAALKCLDKFLDDGETSVGTHISAEHISATPIGMDIYAIATIVNSNGRQVEFEISAYDKCGEIGKAAHTRVVVKAQRFEDKANEKLKEM